MEEYEVSQVLEQSDEVYNRAAGSSGFSQCESWTVGNKFPKCSRIFGMKSGMSRQPIPDNAENRRRVHQLDHFGENPPWYFDSEWT